MRLRETSGTACLEMGKMNGLPRGVTEFLDRGRWRLRFRRKGMPSRYFTTTPGTEEFRAELERFKAEAQPVAKKRTGRRVPPGSMSALIALYYTTPAFTGLAASSKRTYRSTLERFRTEHGDKLVATMQRRHVKAIIGAMASLPQAANKLLDKLHILFALAVDEGWRTDDPTVGVKGYSRKTDGFHTWTEEEIFQYEAVHSRGTTARLAFDLMLYTGQRRSDAVQMGRQHFRHGRVSVRQQKTSARLSIPVHVKLRASIEATRTGDLALLLTAYGKPFTANGIGNKMRDWCDAAGLPACSAHGLRKAAARRMAEAGCSNQQIKSVTGHVTDSEVSRYTAAANQSMLADQAMEALGGTEPEHKSGSPVEIRWLTTL